VALVLRWPASLRQGQSVGTAARSDPARLTLSASQTTFAAALSASIRRGCADRARDTAVVTLLLTPRHFPPQASPNDVLSVIVRAVLRQLLQLAYQTKCNVTAVDGVRATLAVGLHFHVIESLLKDLLRLWQRTFLVFDGISDVPAFDLCRLVVRIVALGFHSVLFVGSPLNTLTQGITCSCDVDGCSRQTSTWAECDECNRAHCWHCHTEGRNRCCTVCVAHLHATGRDADSLVPVWSILCPWWN
jgi:hypothetical protein